MTPLEFSEQLKSDPRGRSESQWLNTLNYLVQSLGEATSCHLHVGSYWCSDEPGDASVSLGARLRSRRPLPGVQSDYWEAASCCSGYGERAYVDVMVFPYFQGRVVTGAGPLKPGAELEQFRWWQYSEGGFVDRGWDNPEGPGEWGWVQKPGDEYWHRVGVEQTDERSSVGEPVTVRLSGFPVPHGHQAARAFPGRVSLIHVNRNRENTNLAPWGASVSGPESRHAIRVSAQKLEGDSVLLDLTRFSIRGGWVPGHYYVSLRVQNCHQPGDWTCSSDISAPFQLTVVE